MEREQKNRLIAGGILVLLGLVATGILALLREQPVLTKETTVTQSTEFAKPRLVGWSKGQRQWMLVAETMHDSGDVVSLETIHEGVIYRADREYLAFQAGHGVWHKQQDSKDSSYLALSGGVTVFQQGESIFRTASLEWQDATGELHAPEQVHFSYQGNTATASSLTLNTVSEDVTLAGDVELCLDGGTRINVEGKLLYNLRTGNFQVLGKQSFDINT